MLLLTAFIKLVNSDFANNNSFDIKLCQQLNTLEYPREGSLTSIYLASEEDLENISGLYFDKCKLSASSISIIMR